LSEREVWFGGSTFLVWDSGQSGIEGFQLAESRP
jgi:hypothetical protein